MDACNNQTLKVAVLHHAGFHMKKIGNKWVGQDGKDFEILKILSDKMDFRYELITPDDKQWGSCDQRGNCTGIIGMVARREADMAISTLSPTRARAYYVDFSTSYFQDEVTFATRKPDTRLIKSVFFTEPFEPRVWMSMACFLIIFLTMTKLLKRLKLLKTQMFGVMNLTAILLRQDASLKMATKEYRSFTIMGSLIVSAGCACKLYECMLTSATSLTSASRPLDTLEDMVDAIENQGYAIGATLGSSPYYQIKSSDLDYLKIFANSTRNKGMETHRSHLEGLLRALNQNYATVAAKEVLRNTALAADLDLSKFHFASEYLFIDQNAVAYGKKFRCKRALNKCLVRIAGSGILSKWEVKNSWLQRKATKTERSNVKYIDFVELELLFRSLITSYAITFGILILEMITFNITFGKPVKKRVRVRGPNFYNTSR